MLPLWYKRSCVAWMLKLSSTLVNGQTSRWTQVTNNSKTSHRSAILKVPMVQIPRKVWDGLSHPQAPCARKTRELPKLWRGLEPTREINDAREARYSKVPITFRARKAVLCLILKMIQWKYISQRSKIDWQVYELGDVLTFNRFDFKICFGTRKVTAPLFENRPRS